MSYWLHELAEAELGDAGVYYGRKTPQAVIEHMIKDDLVYWAWKPGPGCTVPEIPLDKFVVALRAWAKAGAPCPT